MPSSRPRLTLDEQSFQDMLAAAFTIQEHNARRRKEAPQPVRACGQCGVAVAGDAQLCQCCATEPRPGEELQRKWASMWLMSQEQELWPDQVSSPEDEEAANGSQVPPKIQTPAELTSHRFPEPLAIERPAPVSVAPVDTKLLEEFPDLTELENRFEFDERWRGEIEHSVEEQRPSTPGELRILPDPSVIDADSEYPDAEGVREAEAASPMSLRDLRLKLRFHRADFYLVVAIAISTFAMIWVLSATPSPGAHHKPRLRLWERALISLGLADMPETAPVQRGNPNVSVWVDPKTALYYCVGEELYGKAPGGHVATQRDAQLDQFEPAARAACD